MLRYFLLIRSTFDFFNSFILSPKWLEGTFEHAFILTVYNDEDLAEVGFDH